MNAEERGTNIIRAIENTALGEMTVEGGLLLASNLLPPGRLRTAVAWSSVGYTAARRIAKIIKNRQTTNRYYQIKIDESDDLYDEVCSWFMVQIPEHEQYSVEAETEYVKIKTDASGNEIVENTYDEDVAYERPERGKMKERFVYRIGLAYNEKRSKALIIDGHEIRVQHVIPGFNNEEDEDGDMPDNDDATKRKYSSSRYVVINCPTYEARKAVIRKLEETLKQPEFVDRQPSFYEATSWGEFRSNRDIPLRKLESVILKDGQIEAVVDDIQRFLDAEERYNELGMPYHRGILLHGSPGTGKTSIAAAVANHLKLDVYYISLSSLKDNSSLESLLSNVRSRSVLLLEEIDTCVATTERGRDKDGGGGVTMDVLLQKLDGMTTPHGLITIMTTNRLEVLDEAVIRPGRADLKLEITPVNQDQVLGICRHYLGFIPDGLPYVEVEHRITPAEMIEVFKKNIYDVQAAGVELVEYLNTRVAAAKVDELEEMGAF